MLPLILSWTRFVVGVLGGILPQWLSSKSLTKSARKSRCLGSSSLVGHDFFFRNWFRKYRWSYKDNLIFSSFDSNKSVRDTCGAHSWRRTSWRNRRFLSMTAFGPFRMINIEKTFTKRWEEWDRTSTCSFTFWTLQKWLPNIKICDGPLYRIFEW